MLAGVALPARGDRPGPEPARLGQNQSMNSPGLRERKKQKTRWAIQEHALRLFAEQGYEATTVDQIAAAAEISPSTFFRYFPTKEDLVVEDEYDAVFIEGMRALPPESRRWRRCGRSCTTAFDQMADADRAKVLARSKMALAVPALRARGRGELPRPRWA